MANYPVNGEIKGSMHLLHVDSSINGKRSVSRQLTADIVAAFKEANPGATVTYRDYAAKPLPHLSEAMWFARLVAAHEERAKGGEVGEAIAAIVREGGGRVDPSARDDLDATAAALEEFLAADVVVVGAPMYNFTIPSQLKPWIDTLAAPGKTFRYTEKGPEGMVGRIKVIIASSRGDSYSPGAPAAAMDYQETYLSGFFGFIGITDLVFIRAEGIGLGPERLQAGLEKARAVIASLAAPG